MVSGFNLQQNHFACDMDQPESGRNFSNYLRDFGNNGSAGNNSIRKIQGKKFICGIDHLPIGYAGGHHGIVLAHVVCRYEKNPRVAGPRNHDCHNRAYHSDFVLRHDGRSI